MRNIDLPSNLKLEQADINLSMKLRNLGAVFDEYLTLNYEVAALKRRLLDVL